MQTIDVAFANAVDRHQNGQFDEARRIYRLILEVVPDHPAALNNLGLLVAQDEAIPLLRRAVAAEPNYVDALLNLSSALQARGEQAEAATVFDRAVSLIPAEPKALFSLAKLLQTQGREGEAAVQYERAIAIAPDFALALCNLGVIYNAAERRIEAAECFRRAIASDPGLAAASLNLVGMLENEGRVEEAKRFRRGIARPQTLVVETAPNPVRTVLVLANSCTGNIPLDTLLPKQTTTRITWHVEFATKDQHEALPPYDVALNAVGDADVQDESFGCVARFARQRRLLNRPGAVARTRRDRMPSLLAGIPGVVVPKVVRLSRKDARGNRLSAALAAAGIACPVVARPIAGHGGEGATLLENEAQVKSFVPGSADTYYVTAYHETRRQDGFFRKYRMIFIDGKSYAYHLAISDRWLVHYFSAEMLSAPWKREEEHRFLEDPAAVLGAAGMAAMDTVAKRLDLEFAGVDFTILSDGRILIFEANATMLVHLRDSIEDFPYKHSHVPAIFRAFDAMLDRYARPAEAGLQASDADRPVWAAEAAG